MRHVRFYERMREKCHLCGCKNKVRTELIDEFGNKVGFNLKCCNCGRSIDYLDDKFRNGDCCSKEYKKGEQSCIRPTGCPYKDCALYHKKYKPGTPDEEEFNNPNKKYYKPSYCGGLNNSDCGCNNKRNIQITREDCGCSNNTTKTILNNNNCDCDNNEVKTYYINDNCIR